MDFGIKLKELRNKKNLTQLQMAQILETSKSNISKYEAGSVEPSLDTLVKISHFFDVSVDYLLGNDSAQSSPSKEPSYDGYGNDISYWIQKTGYEYAEVAEKLGISESTLKNYMQSKEPIPYQVLSGLSEICEISTDCLLGMSRKSREADLDNVLPFKYDYEIAKRIRRLCHTDSFDTTPSFLEGLLSLSHDEVFYLIEYGFVPHVDTIIKLARYFNVSCDYLLCLVDDKGENAFSSFRKLNEDNKDIIIGKTKELIREQRFDNPPVAADENRKASGK
mgnify:CR=1 FL=1